MLSLIFFTHGETTKHCELLLELDKNWKVKQVDLNIPDQNNLPPKWSLGYNDTAKKIYLRGPPYGTMIQIQ